MCNDNVNCGSGTLQGTRRLVTKPVDQGSVRCKAKSYSPVRRLVASRQNLVQLVFFAPTIYRQGALASCQKSGEPKTDERNLVAQAGGVVLPVKAHRTMGLKGSSCRLRCRLPRQLQILTNLTHHRSNKTEQTQGTVRVARLNPTPAKCLAVF